MSCTCRNSNPRSPSPYPSHLNSTHSPVSYVLIDGPSGDVSFLIVRCSHIRRRVTRKGLRENPGRPTTMTGWLSRYSNLAEGWTTEERHSASRSRQGHSVIVFSKTSGTILGRTQPALLSRVSNDECKNGWSCTSFPLHSFVAWTATFLCA